MQTEPVFDAEQVAIARICEELSQFNDLGSRMRILDYVTSKMVTHLPPPRFADAAQG